MSGWRALLSAWEWYPTVVAGCLALLLAYLAATRFRPGVRGLSYLAGVLALLLALVSPLDALSDEYLFSAHMFQHLLLLMVIPPLTLIGLPPALFERGTLRELASHRLNPLLAWLVGVGVVWLWHLPALYNAALANENVHTLEHLCFLSSAAIFWWPLLAPLEGARLSSRAAVGYLMAAMLSGGILGNLLAYSSLGAYPAYLHPQDTLGILPLLRETLKLTPSIDQQLGGWIMWLLGGLIYLAVMVAEIARWRKTA